MPGFLDRLDRYLEGVRGTSDILPRGLAYAADYVGLSPERVTGQKAWHGKSWSDIVGAGQRSREAGYAKRRVAAAGGKTPGTDWARESGNIVAQAPLFVVGGPLEQAAMRVPAVARVAANPKSYGYLARLATRAPQIADDVAGAYLGGKLNEWSGAHAGEAHMGREQAQAAAAMSGGLHAFLAASPMARAAMLGIPLSYLMGGDSPNPAFAVKDEQR